MNEYHMQFMASGDITVKAESITAAHDRVAEYFRDTGKNQLHTKILKINGELIEKKKE